MSRDLSDELAETLRERAASVPDVPTLAGASLARGRALRRRRRFASALAPALAAVVVVTAATALTGGGDRADGPPRPAGTPTATAGLAAPPPPPYAYKSPADPGPGTFYVVTGSASVRLPGAVVSVMRILRAGEDVVAEVLEKDRQSVVLVGAHGGLRTLPDLLPPVAVTRDGAVLAAQTQEGGELGLALVELPDGKQVATLPGEDRVPLALLRGTDTPVVLFSAGDRLGTWDVSAQSVREVPGVRYEAGSALSADPTGRRVAVADDRTLRVVDIAGRTLWSRERALQDGPVSAWSPDGTKLAVAEGTQAVVLGAADGRTVALWPRPLVEVSGVTWQDAGHVILLYQDGSGYHQRLTCDVAGVCVPYERSFALLPEP